MNSISFRNKWKLRSHLNGVLIKNVDEVYRYMDQYWINDFFLNGNLKLTSFKDNRLTECEVRNDNREGFQDYTIISRDRKRGVKLRADDRDSYRMLCTSTELDLEKQLDYFGVDGCFRINNLIGFGYEVSKVLKGFESGLEGVVNYSNERSKFLLLENELKLPDLESNTPNFNELFQYIDFISKNDNEMFFIKSKLYSLEKEYRFIWKCKQEHELIIHCPGALKYCEKITR